MFWTDLTVDEPQIVLDFYKTLFNWSSFEVPMKDEEEAYVDYGMSIDEQTPGGGICHNRGKTKEYRLSGLLIFMYLMLQTA